MRQITKTIRDDSDKIISETVFRAYFDNDILTIKRVDIIDDLENEQTIMEQPWKCLSDGTRENFADDEDAFAWLESVKDTII